MFKTCRKCDIEKEEANFYKKSLKSGGGVEAVCKECRKASMKVQRATGESYEKRKVKSREYYFRNKEEILERQSLRSKSEEVKTSKRKYYLSNKDRLLLSCKEYRSRNKAKKAAYAKIYREKNPNARARNAAYAAKHRKENPEKVRMLDKQWRANHPDRVRNKNVRRVAAKLRAIPKWASDSGIKAIYKQASEISKLTGIKHHVDHIVPLKSKLVCGLHVENNLQVLEAKENFAKSNLFWPDMP